MTKFLDTKLELKDGKYLTSVNRNRKKPMHWSSKVPKKIKRNIVNNELHRARNISSDFNDEKKVVGKKYEDAGYPKRFVQSIIEHFEQKQSKPLTKKTDDDKTTFVPIRIPFCEKNEKVAKHFMDKLKSFTGNDFKFSIIWQSKKVKTLFKLKDPVVHRANVIYRGTSTSNPDVTYIGETKLIAEKRWNQHQNPNHDSAPSKYLTDNTEDKFTWEVLTGTSSNWYKRRIHEALFIRKHNPVLNRQVEHKKLHLFRNGVT